MRQVDWVAQYSVGLAMIQSSAFPLSSSDPDQFVYTLVCLFTKRYKLVPAKGGDVRYEAGKVTGDLAGQKVTTA